MDKFPVVFSRETKFIFLVVGIFDSFSSLFFIDVFVFWTEFELVIDFFWLQISGMGSVILRGFFFYFLEALLNITALELFQ
mgnify:CR=1 FL=1